LVKQRLETRGLWKNVEISGAGREKRRAFFEPAALVRATTKILTVLLGAMTRAAATMAMMMTMPCDT
jgi:hypothetical protein